MTEQLDMFAGSPPPPPPAIEPAPALPPPEPAPATPPIAGVHWLHVTTKRLSTACGIYVPAFHKHVGAGYAASGEKIACTTNRDDGTVTCPRCLEELT
ncbi:hypothetical protein [Bradyrhizobium sp. 188]|uniref:hypothetical protein n=1 Tax=Bradyrhizobium sp. 188 TaxID=2782656 RepID=UPI001FFACF46|nr:hypothetical protein [Bradyrhizobium sp. 188]MCK1501527.1 hypothetical protein [Bradyrhizobium sp. 188]